MPDTPLMLSLSAALPEARVAQITRDLGRDLSRAGIPAKPFGTPPVPSERGEAVTIGQLVLSLVTSGAVTALIECLKAYFSRERALAIKLTRTDGTHVEVNARNVDTAAIREALEAVTTARSG